jgi:predicted O-methyltransferase YrrM
MRAESPKAASSFEDEYFDFVYIDANHSYASVKADMVWWNKVKEGGVFAGHDYTLDKSATSPAQYAKGVIQAVDEFRDKVKPRAWHVTSEPFPSWMMLK